MTSQNKTMSPRKKKDTEVPAPVAEPAKKRGRSRKDAIKVPAPPVERVERIVKPMSVAEEFHIVPGPPPLQCRGGKNACNTMGKRCAGVKRASCPGWVCLNHTTTGKADGPFPGKTICGTCKERQVGSPSDENAKRKKED